MQAALTSIIGIKAPFILLAFTPYNADTKKAGKKQPFHDDDVKTVIERVFPKGKAPLTGAALLRVVRLVDVYTLAGVLKWCWARLPGGVVTWKTYNRYKADEERAGYKYNSFTSFIDQCVESTEHRDIVENFFLLLVSLAAAEKRNGLNGFKLARLAGTWAFELINPKKEPPSNFEQGLSCWSVAAEACYHMFLAFLRTMYPRPGEMRAVNLPKTLESLLFKEATYPPKPDYKSRLIQVPKITLSVGRLSASPFVLLQRVAKTIPFDNNVKFGNEDDFATLYYLFSDINQIENHMSPESKRILEEITKENCIFSDHKLNIKDTPSLPFDVRAKTWSKSYNHAYINAVTGEPTRPLTNYVYEDHQREMIMRSAMPKQERAPLPYPDSPTLGKRGETKPKIGTLREYDYYYKMSTKDPKYQNQETEKDRHISTDNLATCTLTTINIDDFFVWVWMSSLSQEQTEVTKALFGRSVIVELQLYDGEAGRRWVVVEEILNPKPAPMKKEKKEKKEAAKPAKTEKPAKVKEEKPVKEKKERAVKIVSPVPVPAPRLVKMPAPPKEKVIHIRYDNIDPLVAAVAERLNISSSDHATQTDDFGTARSATTPPPEPTSVSADFGNNKGTQTYNYVSVGISTDSLPKAATPPPQLSKVPNFYPSASDMAIVRSIHVSPAPSPKRKEREPERRPVRSFYSYDDSAIPYLGMANDDTDEADYSIKQISSDATVKPIVDSPIVIKKRSTKPVAVSPPQSVEEFVISIDTDHDPHRRVVSMPVDHTLPLGYDLTDSESTNSGYHTREESEEDFVTRPAPAANYRMHHRSQSSLGSSQRAIPMGGFGLGVHALNISPSARESNVVRRPVQRQPQAQDESLFDSSSAEEYLTPRNMPQRIAPVNQRPLSHPPPRAISPASSNSSNGSNLRGSWGYGRSNANDSLSHPIGAPRESRPISWGPGEQRRDPRDPRLQRDGPPPPGPSSIRGGMSARQIPRDFQHANSEFEGAAGRNYPRPFFSDGKNQAPGANSQSPPRNRYMHASPSDSNLQGPSHGNMQHPPKEANVQQKAPRTTNPVLSIDDMMMDSGPMPGGVRSTKLHFNKPSRPNHSSGATVFPQLASPSNRQQVPTTYHSSPESFDKPIGRYGSDSNYRYDPNERPKASPDSGFANPPGLMNQARNHPMYRSSTGPSSGDSASDSSTGVFDNRQRSNSNLRDYGLPPPIAKQQQHQRTSSSPEVPPHSQASLQYRPAAEIKAPQPRSSVHPQLFAESPLKSVSNSTSTLREPSAIHLDSTVSSVSGASTQDLSSFPSHRGPVAAPPVLSPIHALSEPAISHHTFPAPHFDHRDGSSSGHSGSDSSGSIEKTPPLNTSTKLASVSEDAIPDSGKTLVGGSQPATSQLNRHPSEAASSNYSDERDSEASSGARDFETAFVPNESQTRDLLGYSPPRRRIGGENTSASRNVSPNFPDPDRFDPRNEQSILRAARLNLLGPDVTTDTTKDVASVEELTENNNNNASAGMRRSRLSMAAFLEKTGKMVKKKGQNQGQGQGPAGTSSK